MPESVKRRGSSGPTIGAMVGFSSAVAMGGQDTTGPEAARRRAFCTSALAAVGGTAAAGQHAVDQPVFDGLIRGEEAVALHVFVDLLDRLAGVLRVDLIEPAAERECLLRVNGDVGRLALEATRDLVDQDAAVRRREALAGRATREQQ